MHRFFLPSADSHQAGLTLAGREAHHAARVLRLRPGDPAIVLNGRGTVFYTQVVRADPHQLQVTVQNVQQAPPAPCPITLLQALPKGKTFDIIVQKATELGVSRIVPLLTERVVPRLDPRQAGERRKKWELTAVEAIKQCGSPWLPTIDPPSKPEAWLAPPQPDQLILLASFSPQSCHPRSRFREFLAKHRSPPGSVAVWIGPEGDFSPAEQAAIEAAGALPISLGPLVLRAETAAVYCLSILNYELSCPARD